MLSAATSSANSAGNLALVKPSTKLNSASFVWEGQLSVHFDNLAAPVVVRPSRHAVPHRHLLVKHASDSLDAQLDEWCERVVEALQLNPLDLHPPNLPSSSSSSPILTVGRLQAAVGGGWVLEASRQIGSGVRLPLDLTPLGEYAVFAGQLVCLRGTNPDGRCLQVCEIVQTDAKAQAEVQGPAEINAKAPAITEVVEAAKICVVFGPEVETLEGLAAGRIGPEWTVILGGPLCPLDPTLLPSQQWARMLPPLQRLASQVSQILLLPSLEDAGHDHVLPQCQYHSLPLPLLPPNVLLAGNPACLRKGGLTMALCTLDVMQRMTAAICEVGPPSPERLSRLGGLFLGQGSWYPWDPPRQADPIDRTRWADLTIPPDAQLVIAPSRLKPFVVSQPGGTRLFVNVGGGVPGTPCFLHLNSQGHVRITK